MPSRLAPPPPPVERGRAPARGARALGTPLDFRTGAVSAAEQTETTDTASTGTEEPRKSATETLARRAGALSDEIDFPDFVAGLVHGTFDAIVDASIRQMETFADLVSAVAKSVDDFTAENVSLNQARDWLVQQYPNDLRLERGDSPLVVPRRQGGDGEDEPASPHWLREYELAGEELTAEMIEEALVPRARRKLGQSRQQMLSTMVLLGMNRVVVRDGTIAAKLRFRAAASDRAKVDYAVSDDPSGASTWGARGSGAYSQPSTKVSTVGVNVQAESDLKAELFGEVKLNFASETLPLDRFVDEARRTLLERNARPSERRGPPAATQAPLAAGPPVPAPAPQPAAPGVGQNPTANVTPAPRV